MYVWMCLDGCLHVCVYMYERIEVCMDVRLIACMNVCMDVWMHGCEYGCMDVCMY